MLATECATSIYLSDRQLMLPTTPQAGFNVLTLVAGDPWVRGRAVTHHQQPAHTPDQVQTTYMTDQSNKWVSMDFLPWAGIYKDFSESLKPVLK